jgi:PIN domain nuclease of toxin-antitoxin system
MTSDWKSESHVVLDACALIAFFNDELGAEIVDLLLQGPPSVEMSAVNLPT